MATFSAMAAADGSRADGEMYTKSSNVRDGEDGGIGR